MKQIITKEQLQELAPEQQNKLRDYWMPQPYDQVAYTYKYKDEWVTSKITIKGLYNGNPTKVEEVSCFDGEYVFLKSQCLPLLNIGQMFEILLGCNCIDCAKRMLDERTHNKIYGMELCDALWILIKEYLNN